MKGAGQGAGWGWQPLGEMSVLEGRHEGLGKGEAALGQLLQGQRKGEGQGQEVRAGLSAGHPFCRWKWGRSSAVFPPGLDPGPS